MSEKQNPSQPPLVRGGERVSSLPDRTTSHSTKLSKDDSQVAGYDKGGLGWVCELCDQDGGEVIFRNDFLRVVLIDEPDYPGFCRVICNAHIAEMTDLEIHQRSTMMMTVCKVEQALREVLQPDKINLASLGNMTPHLHWHVIPRFKQDKHFPQPIWGVAQREGKLSLPLDWRARVIKNIAAQLSAMPTPT